MSKRKFTVTMQIEVTANPSVVLDFGKNGLGYMHSAVYAEIDKNAADIIQQVKDQIEPYIIYNYNQ